MELEMDVEDLLNKRKLESDRIEFKTGWNPDDIYHSVCAFANDYNNDVKAYNLKIKKFPNNIIAGIFNFEEKTYFEADVESTEVPNVTFE